MKNFAFLFCLGLAIILLADSQQCGRSVEFNRISSRIFGGESTTYGEIPWQVGLFENGNRKCGGTIVHPKWVLTATHCVILSFLNQNAKKEYQIRAGDHSVSKFDEYEQDRYVVRIELHPGFNTITLIHDIALLEVDRAFEYNDYVIPACLPTLDEAPYPFTECTVSGWGFDTPFTKPDTLMKLHIPIFPHKMCQIIHRPGITSAVFLSNMTCAGDLKEGKDPCKGDSGGPLTCPRGAGGVEVVTGIVSWGNGCGEKGEAGVYTRVESYLEWVLETLDLSPVINNDPCKYSGVKLTNKEGIMTSPGFLEGENYQRSVRCLWDVDMSQQEEVTSSSKLLISFSNFDVEASPDNMCRYDYVEVYYGKNFRQLLGRYCGEENPSNIELPYQQSSGLQFRVVFRSDNTVTKQGFQSNFQLIN